MDAKPELLSRKEVARLLGVSEWTVKVLIRRKELPKGRRMGDKMVKWFRRDVDDYLARLRWLGEEVDEEDDDEAEEEPPPRKKVP